MYKLLNKQDKENLGDPNKNLINIYKSENLEQVDFDENEDTERGQIGRNLDNDPMPKIINTYITKPDGDGRISPEFYNKDPEIKQAGRKLQPDTNPVSKAHTRKTSKTIIINPEYLTNKQKDLLQRLYEILHNNVLETKYSWSQKFFRRLIGCNKVSI